MGNSAILLAYRSGIPASFEIPTCENYKPFAGSSKNIPNNSMICCVIFGINNTRDISKLSQISLAVTCKNFEI